MVALALQWCAIILGAPPEILCSTVQDLWRFLKPLIQRDDLLDASMLEVAEEPVTSPNLVEEAMLLGDKPEPQEELATTPHTPNQPEEASGPEEAISSGVMDIMT